MFAVIKRRWQMARGTALLAEVEEVVTKLPAYPPVALKEFIEGYVGALAVVEKRYGDITNISDRLKKDVVEELTKAARNSFDRNVGRATGVFMASAKVEALALPGPDAMLVMIHIAAIEEMTNEVCSDEGG